MSEKSPTHRMVRHGLLGLLVVLVGVVAGYSLRVWHAGAEASGEMDHGPEAQVAGESAKAQIWTCSMHPQIKVPTPGKCPICFMDLIPLEDDSEEGDGWREVAVGEAAAKRMELATAPVERRFVNAEVRMVGKIAYDETRVSYITAWVPGRLDRLFVDYTGVPVKKGDHMVSLYSPELLGAQEELLQAMKTVEELRNSDMRIVVDTARATVDAARERLRLWGLTAEQIAAIEQRRQPDDHITIYAPAGGIVTHKNAQQGMYVSVGTRIYTIVDLSQVWVYLDAYESDLAWLRYGQRVEFTAEAYPGEVFKGSISFIQPVLDEGSRTVKVRVNVPNESGRLKPGMFVRAAARARLATGGRVMDAALADKWISPMHPEIVKDAPGPCDVCGMPLVRAESLGYVGSQPAEEDRPLVIPATAPLLTGKRAIVYVQIPNRERPTYEGREILLGAKAGDHYIVLRGLAEGERVVVKGNFKLDAELQIRAKPSMMSPAGGALEAGDGHPDERVPDLPALARSQLEDALAAGRAAVAASARTDLDRIREAYGKLRERVDAVDKGQLAGAAAAVWREYAMLLGNDGQEGSGVRTRADAVALARTAQGHLDAVQAKFGLRSGGEESPSEAVELDSEFREQLGGVVAGYLAIQTALALDDAAAAAASARQTLIALAAVDMELAKGQFHRDWMAVAGDLKTLLGELAAAEGIEPARATFALLSEQVAAVLASFGVPEGTLYGAHCPMAFAGRGASWIQAGDQLRNPYFGAAMLRCGEIRRVWK